jgi:hypothetical protein
MFSVCATKERGSQSVGSRVIRAIPETIVLILLQAALQRIYHKALVICTRYPLLGLTREFQSPTSRKLDLNYAIGGSTLSYRHHPKRAQWIRHAIERPGNPPSFVLIIGSLEYI